MCGRAKASGGTPGASVLPFLGFEPPAPPEVRFFGAIGLAERRESGLALGNVSTDGFSKRFSE